MVLSPPGDALGPRYAHTPGPFFGPRDRRGGRARDLPALLLRARAKRARARDLDLGRCPTSPRGTWPTSPRER
jgi:hypothetical protein